MPDIPLEIKMLVIRELSPSSRILPARHVEDKNAAYFRDLRAVCLVWPETMAIIREILFEKISLRTNDHDIDASLRNLCQALENDPSLPTFVKTLEFSHQDINEESLLIPPFSRSLFLSFLSFIPEMHKLEVFRLDNMHLHEETSIESLEDLGVLRESSLKELILSNGTFSITAFHVFFSQWYDTDLEQVSVDAISLLPPIANVRMLLELKEDMWDWDDNDTWTEWGVDKPPRVTSPCYVNVLHLTLSRSSLCGMLMLMDLLASQNWSPFAGVDLLEISVHASSSLAMTAMLVNRINNLIRRYEFSFLSLESFSTFKDAVHTPLDLGGIEMGEVHLKLLERFALFRPDEHLFNWYVESLGAVSPDSRLRKFCLALAVLVPVEEKDLGSQGVWGEMDAALSGENLQFKTLIIDVFLKPPSNGVKTVGLAHLRTWLMEICFPKVTAKYFRCKTDETEEEEMSALHFHWIRKEQVDA